jgi:hypothetical protein
MRCSTSSQKNNLSLTIAANLLTLTGYLVSPIVVGALNNSLGATHSIIIPYLHSEEECKATVEHRVWTHNQCLDYDYNTSF